MKPKRFLVRCERCGRLNRVHEEHVRLERCPYCLEQFVRGAAKTAKDRPPKKTRGG